MKRVSAVCLLIALTISSASAQTTQAPQKPKSPPPENAFDDVIRIKTELVQTDVVVTDKNDSIVVDLKLEDFELFENGKKQDLQFMEFVSVDAPGGKQRNEPVKIAPDVDTSVPRDLTAKDVRRVIAFVVDDVTIPAEDNFRVRQMLLDFVDNKMADGDLVAIVRTVGGKGLLEQFTADRQILRRAISQLGVRSVPPHLAFTGDADRVVPPSPLADTTSTETLASNTDFDGPNEGTNQIPRAILALSVSNYVIDSLRQIPGRKSLVLLSGGLPLFDLSRTGSIGGDIGQLFRRLTDNATRSGVVINTMDVRGLEAAGVVARFEDTPGRSALGGGTFAGNDVSTVGRGYDRALLGERSLTEQLTLRQLADRTGGISVVNSNNFSGGLEKILNRSRGYYRLAYRPSEPFDNKFHHVTIKVSRKGVNTYAAAGFYAREDKSSEALTREDEIIRTAMSPLAKRDLDIATELQYKFLPDNHAQLDINTFIDAHKLQFVRSSDGKYQASFDIAGFVFDQLGRSRGGISQTVTAVLSEGEYQRAVASGLSYTASTKAPPGYYQVRLVAREVSTGKIGSVSRYFEVPDLANKRLTLSSIVLYETDSAKADTAALQLSPTRVISRKRDLRYAVVIYNTKLSNSKPQARSQLIISQAGKVLFKEAEQPIQMRGAAAGEFVKVGQLGLANVAPGRYVMTLVVVDPLADKKRRTASRSIDFTLVN